MKLMAAIGRADLPKRRLARRRSSRLKNILPWFDRPDALDAVCRHGRSREEATLLEKWIRDGYVIVEDCVDPADIDAMVATLDGLWDAPRPIPNLTLLGLREKLDGEQRDLAHGALLALDPATRRRMRRASDWRIHGFHYVNGPARRIFWNRRLRAIASRIFGRPARPIAAINFMTGTRPLCDTLPVRQATAAPSGWTGPNAPAVLRRPSPGRVSARTPSELRSDPQSID